jgi:metal-responsive CopG/Arc/MetJ family transcriptional regulator
MNRVKVSVSIDPDLLRAVDCYVADHHGTDRSKIIDQALELWTAAQQDAAMVAQFAAKEEGASEVKAWRTMGRAAASRRLART